MNSLNYSHDLVVVLEALIPALVDGDVHVHDHEPGICLLSNQQLDKQSDIGMTAHQFLKGPVVPL
jgi:hypothetical protein